MRSFGYSGNIRAAGAKLARVLKPFDIISETFRFSAVRCQEAMPGPCDGPDKKPALLGLVQGCLALRELLPEMLSNRRARSMRLLGVIHQTRFVCKLSASISTSLRPATAHRRGCFTEHRLTAEKREVSANRLSNDFLEKGLVYHTPGLSSHDVVTPRSSLLEAILLELASRVTKHLVESAIKEEGLDRDDCHDSVGPVRAFQSPVSHGFLRLSPDPALGVSAPLAGDHLLVEEGIIGEDDLPFADLPTGGIQTSALRSEKSLSLCAVACPLNLLISHPSSAIRATIGLPAPALSP